MKLSVSDIVALVVICAFSVLAGSKLFTTQFYTTHDGGGHIIRMEEFSLALSEGQFPVRIAKRINYGLGYPYFHFNYPLVYYSSDVLHRAGLSFVEAFKLILFVSLAGGSVGMYLYTRFFFRMLPALTASLFYLIVPYRFLNIYVRGALGEAVGMALLPFVLFGVEYLLRKKKHSLLPFVVSFSTLILSHNITALIGSMVVALYAVCRILMLEKARRKVQFHKILLASITSVLLTAWFWAPALYDSRLTKLAELREDYKEFFPMLSELIYSPWGFGPWREGEYPGKMSPRIGVVHLLTGIWAFILLLYQYTVKKRTRSSSHTADYVAVLFASIVPVFFFLSLSLSEPIWDITPILQVVQLPWRFVGYIVLSLSFLAGYAVSRVSSIRIQFIVIFALTGLLLYTNRNHIRVNQYITHQSPFNNKQIYELSTTSKDEHMPLHAPRVYDKAPNPNGDIIPTHAGVSLRETWLSNYHRFSVTATESSFFRDNTSYFPGWVAAVNGDRVAIHHEEDEYRRLLIQLPSAGEYTVEFWFIEPPYRKIVNGISVATLLFSLYFLIKGGSGAGNEVG